jgi:hypothetical protein
MATSEPIDTTDPGVTGRDRLSTAAFVVGLVAAVTGVVYFVAVPTGLVGLVLGVLALRRPGAVRRIALGGVMLSLIGLVVGLGVLTYLLLDDDDSGGETTVVDGIESGTGDTANPPQRDLGGDLTCQADASALRAIGEVTNDTDAMVDYHLIAMWTRDGRTIAEATAIIESVPPSATVPWEVVAVGDDTSGVTTCRVIRIDRTPT